MNDRSQPFAGVQARSSVDNLLRTVQQHHVQLSLMADTKASILITISSIVLTIALSRSGDPNLRVALLTLASAALISLLLAVVAVLPTFAAPRFVPPDFSRNLLFFGHFASMPEEEFMTGSSMSSLQAPLAARCNQDHLTPPGDLNETTRRRGA